MTIVKKVSAWVRKLSGQAAPEKASGPKEKVPLGMKRCPQCAKVILRSAVRCVHCGYFFSPATQ